MFKNDKKSEPVRAAAQAVLPFHRKLWLDYRHSLLVNRIVLPLLTLTWLCFGLHVAGGTSLPFSGGYSPGDEARVYGGVAWLLSLIIFGWLLQDAFLPSHHEKIQRRHKKRADKRAFRAEQRQQAKEFKQMANQQADSLNTSTSADFFGLTEVEQLSELDHEHSSIDLSTEAVELFDFEQHLDID